MFNCSVSCFCVYIVCGYYSVSTGVSLLLLHDGFNLARTARLLQISEVIVQINIF